MDERFTVPLAARLDGEDRLLRAGLVAASVTGLVISSTVVRTRRPLRRPAVAARLGSWSWFMSGALVHVGGQ